MLGVGAAAAVVVAVAVVVELVGTRRLVWFDWW